MALIEYQLDKKINKVENALTASMEIIVGNTYDNPELLEDKQ